MGGRGARGIGRKSPKISKADSSSTQKLNAFQIKVRKKRLQKMQLKRSLQQRVSYDSKDNRITRTHAESRVQRLGTWRTNQMHKSRVSAVSLTHGAMKKRWAKHYPNANG